MINHAIQTDVRQRHLETPVQKRVLMALASLSNENGEVNRSIPELCTVAQACPHTIMRVLRELEELEEISILSVQRVRGHYRINRLPNEDKPRIDSIRTPIADAIRMLPLPVRISEIFRALAKYASRSGNNIFPSLKTISRDTCYSEKVVRETVHWLLVVGFIAPDECVNPKYQTRSGYKIPGWNFLTQQLAISDEQVEQIKALYRQRHNRYWVERKNIKAGQAQASASAQEDEVTWLEDHSFDFDEYQGSDGAQFDEDSDEPVKEELAAAEEETVATIVPAALDYNQPAPPPTPTTPGDRVRLLIHANRARMPRTVDLAQYNAAIEAIQPHLALLDDHRSGRIVADPGALKKAEAMIAFYRRTIETYEAQLVQRE